MMHSLHLNFPAIVPKSNFDTKKPGLTMLSDPIVFLDDFRQCCRTPYLSAPPAGGIGDGGIPCKRVLTSKRYACAITA